MKIILHSSVESPLEKVEHSIGCQFASQPKFVLRKQSGFSLIEIMISALVLSVAILGTVGLQVVSMKGTHQSYMKHQAMSVVQNLTERMRANIAGVRAGSYEDNSTTFACGAYPACNTAISLCSANDIARIDLHDVICGYGTPSRTGGVKSTALGDRPSLINGSVSIACRPAAGNCTAGDVTITVGWAERQMGKEVVAPDANGATDFLVINTRILP